ncbi:hypothetical protein EKO23_05895 [Nocardioides guangzhouensis]|uniref:Uncharacterized protein n=1 Tax=Nocardioides guangzhouensis TaxID=2497878 RepID=A0A4Q4ZJG0_9ACTN|nr:hypothetical protein EKO23_05895 [Nocardioides guangzhouensis]
MAVALVLVAGVAGALTAASSFGSSYDFPEATPKAQCGPGARPETSYQGRVPARDYTTGRAAKGYRCNTREIAHHGTSGGFKVHRYTDRKGNTCAFYDSTLVFPRDVLANAASGTGVVVLDMTDPARPRQTATLTTPAMESPHETLLLNRRRGLLAGVLGTAATYPGVLDIYDVRTDCRHPRLLSTTPSGLLGHESGWSPDGRTFWSSSTVASLVAVDVTNPRLPTPVFSQLGVQYHGMRLSADGRELYAANIGSPGPTGVTGGGLRILDVSEVQDHEPDPQVGVLSDLTWRERSIPQVAEPFSRDGRDYLLEVDEFTDLFSFSGLTDPVSSPVGAARIIDVEDPRHPRVVSDIRLEAHQPDRRAGQTGDPGASFPAQGYAAHYCSLPRRKAPNLVGCSMILSGLRVFDIRDVRHPREVAYFNRPLMPGKKVTLPNAEGAYAMSAPAWDVGRRSIWYSDANTGFYVVRLTNGVGRLLD